MSQQKKMEKFHTQGFAEACDFWEIVLDTTPRIGPKLKARIMAQLGKVIRESEKDGE